MGVGRLNIDNRRLREIQVELKAYNELLEESVKEADKQIYKGKIESLEREQKEILERMDVIV